MTLAADLPLPPARPPRAARRLDRRPHRRARGAPVGAHRRLRHPVHRSAVQRLADRDLYLPRPLDGGGVQESGNLGWLPIELYVVLLSVVSEVLAFAAVGLIAPWGEVFPRWIPGLRGRRVPVAAAVVPAGLGAAVLTVVPLYSAVMLAGGRTLTGQPLDAGIPLATHDWRTVVLVVCYAPLLLWGPMLAAVTVGYWRRRRGTPRRRGGRPRSAERPWNATVSRSFPSASTPPTATAPQGVGPSGVMTSSAGCQPGGTAAPDPRASSRAGPGRRAAGTDRVPRAPRARPAAAREPGTPGRRPRVPPARPGSPPAPGPRPGQPWPPWRRGPRR
ncbi:hypothetical protein ACFQ0M_03610 [Kitasatospora aburaviensis]